VGADLHVDPMRGLDCPHHCRCRVRLRQGKLHGAGIDSLRGAERVEDLGEVPGINIRQNKQRFDRPPDQWRPKRAFEPVDVCVIAGERVLVATDHELGAEGSRIPAHGDPQNHMSIPVGAVGAQPLNSGLPGVAHDGDGSILRRYGSMPRVITVFAVAACWSASWAAAKLAISPLDNAKAVAKTAPTAVTPSRIRRRCLSVTSSCCRIGRCDRVSTPTH